MSKMDWSKDFRKTFDGIARTRSRGEAFANFVEIAAAAVHQTPYHAGLLEKDETYTRVEDAYMKAIGRLDKGDVDEVVKLYSIATAAILEEPHDFLGQTYMAMEIGNDNAGQFFTPPSVSRVIAQMGLDNVEEVIKEKGVVTIGEPAVDGGGMLIEAANVIRDKGFDPANTMWFQATDIDRTCFNMAYFQLSTMGLCGEVIHGNALSMETWETRSTPSWNMVSNHRKANWEKLETIRAQAEPKQRPVTGKQLSLDLEP